jgi:hypothetical protein
MGRRSFTVEEANQMIPVLEGTLDEIEKKKEEIGRYRGKLQILDALWGEKVSQPKNPDYGEFRRHRGCITAAVKDVDRLVRRRILGIGLRFPPGGLEHGLIDFPTTFEGRWVFLCWQRGEDRVRFWHEIDGGYAGRQQIAAEHLIAMGKEDSSELPDDSILEG